MAAGKYSFSVEQGATTSFQVVYKDVNANPVDLSGYQARMQIRETIASSTVICRLSSSLDADGTGLNLSGSAGTLPLSSGSIGVYISAASSSGFTFDTAVYDLELVTGGTVTRLLQGTIKLDKEVTR
jgi:hypothetical protein